MIKGDMYKYLIAKSICDSSYCIGNIFSVFLFSCFECSFKTTLWFMVFKLIIVKYLKPSSMMFTILLEFFAIFDRYRLITNKLNCLRKLLTFRKTIAAVIIVVFSIYSYEFYMFRIISFPLYTTSENETSLVYSIEGIPSGFYSNILFNFVLSTTVNLFLTLVVLFFNILTLLAVKSSLKYKARLTPTATRTTNEISSSETRNTLMLIWTCPLVVLPNLIYFLADTFGLIAIIGLYNACLEAFGEIIFSLQFSSSFFFIIFSI